VEEKYEKPAKPSNKQYGDKYDEDSESSNDEDEDDEGFLATEALDAEISATLQALRSKDPRVYDEKVTFYAPIEEDEDEESGEKKEKPMYLRDYHRENLLQGNIGAEDAMDVDTPKTFAQEQDALKKSIVQEMHAAAEDDSSEDEEEGGGFLVPKAKPQAASQGIHPSRASKIELDVNAADKDPETFLSNFMAARAWVPDSSLSSPTTTRKMSAQTSLSRLTIYGSRIPKVPTRR
jgi:protein KRI1